MLDRHWQVSSIVEKSELTHWDPSSMSCSSNWFLSGWLSPRHIKARCLSSKSISFLQNGSSSGGNGHFLLCNWSNLGHTCCLLLDVVLWEISECRMLSSWQVLVLVWLPLLWWGHSKTFLQMVLQNQLTCWGNSSNSERWLHLGHFCNFLFKTYFKIIKIFFIIILNEFERFKIDLK